MGVTTDPDDPRLTHGANDEAVPMAPVYLVLPEEERTTGWVRPYRETYRHVGAPGPTHPLLDLTTAQRTTYEKFGYAKYEAFPPEDAPMMGRFWTQEKIDAIGKGCGTVTTMNRELSETYARDPHFYGATYCAGCKRHRPVEEFVWDQDGTRVGS